MEKDRSGKTTKGGKSPGRFRLQFDTTTEERESIESVRRRGGLRTFTDVLRTGVRMLDWYLRNKEEGWTIAATKDGKTKELELLW